MREFLEKKVHDEKIVRYLMLVFFALFFICTAFIPILDEAVGVGALVAIVMLPFAIGFTFLVIYYAKFYYFVKGYKQLVDAGMLDYVDDINLNEPTFAKSKLYCGRKALYCKSSGCIVPYSQIGWVYIHANNIYGITVNKEVYVFMRNGQKLVLSVDVNDFKIVLERFILRESPDVVIGYGNEQRKRYKALNPQSKLRTYKNMRIGSYVLFAMSIFFAVMGIVSDGTDVPRFLAFLVVFVGVAITLFILGNRKVEAVPSKTEASERVSSADDATSSGADVGVYYEDNSGETQYMRYGIPQQAPAESGQYLDDYAFVGDVNHIVSGPWHQYDVMLNSRGYGWDYAVDWVAYLATIDIKNISEVTVGSMGIDSRNITASWTNNGFDFKKTPELSVEAGVLSIAGFSATLDAPTKIVLFNQTRALRIFTLVDDEFLVRKYVETCVRRSFGTENAMKLGKPFPQNVN